MPIIKYRFVKEFGRKTCHRITAPKLEEVISDVYLYL